MTTTIEIGELPQAAYSLTAREAEVLTLLALGLSHRQVGRRLVIELDTVEKHAQHIRSKLKAGNTAHAVALAVATGLIKIL